MSTTSLLLEILVIGTTADIWVVIIILAAFSPSTTEYATIIDTLSKLSTFLVLPSLALTYLLGWIINFICEHTLEPLFQTKFKSQLFGHEELNYEHVRALFFQKASENVVRDMNFDRQLIFISRASILNFLIIAVGLLLHFKNNPSGIMAGVVMSVIISILSFSQWTVQYKSSYKKMLSTYRILLNESPKSAQVISKKKK
jgi:hypothetical protein